jgi:hypothetical protein
MDDAQNLKREAFVWVTCRSGQFKCLSGITFRREIRALKRTDIGGLEVSVCHSEKMSDLSASITCLTCGFQGSVEPLQLFRRRKAERKHTAARIRECAAKPCSTNVVPSIYSTPLLANPDVLPIRVESVQTVSYSLRLLAIQPARPRQLGREVRGVAKECFARVRSA